MGQDQTRRVGRPPAHLVAHLGELVSVVAPDGTVLSVNQAPEDRTDQLPPQSALTWVHPDDQQVVADAFATLVRDPQARTRTLVRVRRDGDPAYRHMETTGINRCDDPDVGGLVFVSRDVEDRVQTALQAERSLQAQALVADLGVRLLTAGGLDPLLEHVLQATAALLQAPYLTLAERDVDGALRVTRQHGPDPLPPGHLLAAVSSRAPELRERGVLSTAEARLEGPSGPLGVLVAGWTDEHAFDEVQRQLLQGVANVLAGARLREQRENDAVVRALHDTLTGLPTRPLLLDRLDHALARSRRGGTDVAVLMVDLDRFKQVNDRYGHAAGDAVLAQLGARLAAHVRPGDTAARLHGDEFVVLCEDVAGLAVVQELVERLRGVFAEPYDLPGGERLVLSGSIGAACSSTAGHDRDALLHAADLAMYDDKRARTR